MKYSKEEAERLIVNLADLLGKFPTKKDIESEEFMPSYKECLSYGISLRSLSAEYIKNKYDNNPKTCLTCSQKISFDLRTNTFCGSSCAAKSNNRIRFEKRVDLHCLNCNTAISRSRLPSNSFYCNNTCQMGFQKEKNKAAWIAGEMPNASNIRLRGFLTDLVGHECSVCKISEWCGKPIVLEVEHKNGDSNDNSVENVCLICPNCHSQTETYKGRNRGNGRHARRQRYAEGKSY